MKKGLLFTLITTFHALLYGQTTFDKVVREFNLDGVLANTSYLNENRELIVSGNIQNNLSHISKLDSLGIPIWTRTYDGSDQNDPFGSSLNKDVLIRLQDSNYLLTRNLIGFPNGPQTYLIKFDENGNLIWSNRVHYNSGSINPNSLTVELNNGKILHVNQVFQSSSVDIFIINSNGQLEYSESLFNNTDVKPVALVRDSNSTFLVSKWGSTESIITHINDTGSIINSKIIENCAAIDAVFLDSKIHVLGEAPFLGKVFASVDYSSGSTEVRSWDIDATRLSGFNGFLYAYDDYANNTFIATIDLNSQLRYDFFHFAGTVNIHFVDTSHLYFVGNGPAYGIKIFGEPQIGISFFEKGINGWCANGPFYQPPGAISMDTITSIPLNSTTPSQLILDTLTLSWESHSLISQDGCIDYISSIDEYNLFKTITLSPNPANEIVKIKSEELIISKVKIFGLNGQEFPVKMVNNQFDVSTLTNGIYFVHVTIDSGFSLTKKLLIKH